MKNYLLAGCCVCSLIAGSLNAAAQSQEFSIAAGGGMNGLQYKLKHGSASLQPGFQFGFGYMKGLGRSWGIRTGIELGMYRSKATLSDNTLFTSYNIDSEGSAFEYQVKANGYKETQQLLMIDIPLMLQFHSAKGTGFYGMGGLKASLPLDVSYKTTASQISAAGYYPHANVVITDLPSHGFGTQNGWSGKGDYSFKPSFALAAEAGWRFALSHKYLLYAGFYFDYGLNDMKKTEGANALLTYQPSGLAQSQAAGVFSLKDETGAAKLMAYGVKFRFAFGSHKKKKEIVIPPLPPVPDTVVAQSITQPDTVIIRDNIPPPPVDPVREIPDTLTAAEIALLETPVLFGKVGDTALSTAAQEHLQKIAALLQAHPGITVQVQGHTCNIGTDAINEKIGMVRAKAVAEQLQKNGVESSRLQVLSSAHFEPVAPNTSEASRRKNRRVILKLL